MGNGWKAEAWIGSVNRVEFVPAPMSLDDREAGLTVRDVHPEPLAFCACCGTPLWHHWIFQNVSGGTCTIGTSCAAVILGKTPASYLKDERDRAEADAAEQREMAELADRRSWYRAPEQADLRLAVVLGARAERQASQGAEFYRRARKAAQRGAVSDKYRDWIVRSANGDAYAAASRTSSAMENLRLLGRCRLGMYDADIIMDLHDREMPLYDVRKAWGAPLSEKQVELVAKKAHRYRKQIAGLEAADARLAAPEAAPPPGDDR